jgi:gamma-glutamylcyclotransferase (GGCT)/AIG2-like uncharacterized protein YtfP
MLYFAYGSNMCRDGMRQRCPQAHPLGVATLRDHAFMIMANGFASVLPAPGKIVRGALWRIGPRDLVALDAYENVAGGLYRRVTMPVEHDGAQKPALVYLGEEQRSGLPRAGYLEAILAAARQWALPEDYVMALSRHGGETTPSMRRARDV